MTVSSGYTPDIYTGNGTLTIYPYTFRILQASDLLVQLKNISTGVFTTLILNTDYTVSSVGSGTGGNVTFTSAPTSAYQIVLSRDVTIEQEQDYRENDPFPAETVETALD